MAFRLCWQRWATQRPDSTFHVGVDTETGETLIAGMGELHLDVLIDRLDTDHGVRVRTGAPKMAYRETITAAVRGHVVRYSKQTGGPGQFAHVVVDLEPVASHTVVKSTLSIEPVEVRFLRRMSTHAQRALVMPLLPGRSPGIRWSVVA